jgi:hypothetical protein
MERRRAVIAAATASLTLLAGAAAVSLNTGIIGASGDAGVGQISPVVATTPASTLSGSPSWDDPTSRVTGGEHEGDEYGEDDRYDDRSAAGDDNTERTYEGADDDD